MDSILNKDLVLNKECYYLSFDVSATNDTKILNDMTLSKTMMTNYDDVNIPIMNSIHNKKLVAEDLYSHQYGLWSEPIKTISNTKNIIIPLINGTGILMPVMIIFCIRDSLREYKSNFIYRVQTIRTK